MAALVLLDLSATFHVTGLSILISCLEFVVRIEHSTEEYMTIKRGDNIDEAVHAIEDCQADIRTWMDYKFLKLSRDKTKLIVFTSKQC